MYTKFATMITQHSDGAAASPNPKPLSLLVAFRLLSFYHQYMSETELRANLEKTAHKLGASVFGVCKTTGLAERFHPEIRERAAKLTHAVSVGVALQKAVLDTLTTRPNQIYKAHYRETNATLDRITFALAQIVTKAGYQALPIPASMVLSRKPQIGHLNHREIAFASGLGWRGNNNLLVNPKYGSRLRLATLLTDAKLETNAPSIENCKACHACQMRCPAEAIGRGPFEFDLSKCAAQVIRFSKENDYGFQICGLCLNSCPERRP